MSFRGNAERRRSENIYYRGLLQPYVRQILSPFRQGARVRLEAGVRVISFVTGRLRAPRAK